LTPLFTFIIFVFIAFTKVHAGLHTTPREPVMGARKLKGDMLSLTYLPRFIVVYFLILFLIVLLLLFLVAVLVN
jgi:hypothetical protein